MKTVIFKKKIKRFWKKKNNKRREELVRRVLRTGKEEEQEGWRFSQMSASGRGRKKRWGKNRKEEHCWEDFPWARTVSLPAILWVWCFTRQCLRFWHLMTTDWIMWHKPVFVIDTLCIYDASACMAGLPREGIARWNILCNNSPRLFFFLSLRPWTSVS